MIKMLMVVNYGGRKLEAHVGSCYLRASFPNGCNHCEYFLFSWNKNVSIMASEWPLGIAFFISEKERVDI